MKQDLEAQQRLDDVLDEMFGPPRCPFGKGGPFPGMACPTIGCPEHTEEDDNLKGTE